MHRRIGGAHLHQHFLRRDAPIHHPDPLGFAVKLFDLIQKSAQGRFVRRVARQHLVGERKTFRRDHQRNNHLRNPVFYPGCSRTAVCPLQERADRFQNTCWSNRRATPRTSPRRDVPAHPAQMLEERRAMLQHLVQAPIQVVLLRQPKILPSKSAIALCANHCRCSRHSLPGSISR